MRLGPPRRGNREDVWSRGHICPKGTSLAHLHTDPDRLREPMVRTPLGHVPVSLPHGWGHGLDHTQLQVANDHPGVNSNLLNPAHLVDVPSNTQVVNGVPSRVRTP